MVVGLILLSLVSCAKPIPKMVSIDPTFQPYVDSFVADAKSVGVNVTIDNLSIHFTNGLAKETLGECTTFTNNATPTIQIDAQDWPNESDDYRKIVLYHELSHCVLNRAHVTTGTIVNGRCVVTSIMYPDIESQTDMYTDNWNYYVQELFHSGTVGGQTCYFNGYYP